MSAELLPLQSTAQSLNDEAQDWHDLYMLEKAYSGKLEAEIEALRAALKEVK